jgi:hypothetical protein
LGGFNISIPSSTSKFKIFFTTIHNHLIKLVLNNSLLLNNISNSAQVWCDMSTDGGGWVLVGRKNNSVTWTVPSNNKPVEPFGEPHWSSSLGDAQVVDFRVQVATKEDFKSTRAHW